MRDWFSHQMVWKCPYGCKSTRRYDTSETEFYVPCEGIVDENGEVTRRPRVGEGVARCFDCGEIAEWVEEPKHSELS